MGIQPEKSGIDIKLLSLDEQLMNINNSMKNRPYDHEKFAYMQKLRRLRNDMVQGSYYDDPGNYRFNKELETKRVGALKGMQGW
jgi:hypothetical protein